MNIKKGDKVLITTGKDSGKSGKVASVNPKENRIVVEGLNMINRAIKPKKMGETGQIVSVAAPLNVSNAMIVCPLCGKTTRVGSKMEGDKKKRVCKKCGGSF